MCEVFGVAQAGAQYHNANIGESCILAPLCKDGCIAYDPTGKTPKVRVVEQLVNDIRAKEHVQVFFDRLQARQDKLAQQATIVTEAQA